MDWNNLLESTNFRGQFLPIRLIPQIDQTKKLQIELFCPNKQNEFWISSFGQVSFRKLANPKRLLVMNCNLKGPHDNKSKLNCRFPYFDGLDRVLVTLGLGSDLFLGRLNSKNISIWYYLYSPWPRILSFSSILYIVYHYNTFLLPANKTFSNWYLSMLVHLSMVP